MTHKVERKTVAVGYAVMIFESEAGWGTKPDGYMVGVSKEALDQNKIEFEAGNTSNYGLYYERTARGYEEVSLTEEAVKALETSRKGIIWFKNRSQFEKEV